MSWKSKRDRIKYEWTNINLAQETSKEHGIQTTAWPLLAALSQAHSETEKLNADQNDMGNEHVRQKRCSFNI